MFGFSFLGKKKSDSPPLSPSIVTEDLLHPFKKIEHELNSLHTAMEMAALKVQYFVIAESISKGESVSSDSSFKKKLFKNAECQAVITLFSSMFSESEAQSLCFLTLNGKRDNCLEAYIDREKNVFFHAYHHYALLLSRQVLKSIQNQKLIPILEDILQNIDQELEKPDSEWIDSLKYIRETDEIAEEHHFFQLQTTLSERYQQLTILCETWDKPFSPASLAKSSSAIAFICAEYLKSERIEPFLLSLSIPQFSSYKKAKKYFGDPVNYGLSKKLFLYFSGNPVQFKFSKNRWREVLHTEMIERLLLVPQSTSREISRIFNFASIDKVLIPKSFIQLTARYFDMAQQEGKRTRSIFMTHQIVWRDMLNCIKSEFFSDSFFPTFFEKFRERFENIDRYVLFLYQLFNPDESEKDFPSVSDIPYAVYEQIISLQMATIILSQRVLKEEVSAKKALAAFSFFKYFNQYISKELIESLRNRLDSFEISSVPSTLVLIDEALLKLSAQESVEDLEKKEAEICERIKERDYRNAYPHDRSQDDTIQAIRIRKTFPPFEKHRGSLISEILDESKICLYPVHKPNWHKVDPKTLDKQQISPYITFLLYEKKILSQTSHFLFENFEKAWGLALDDMQRVNLFCHIIPPWDEQIQLFNETFQMLRGQKKSPSLLYSSSKQTEYENLYTKIEKLYILLSGYSSFEEGENAEELPPGRLFSSSSEFTSEVITRYQGLIALGRMVQTQLPDMMLNTQAISTARSSK